MSDYTWFLIFMAAFGVVAYQRYTLTTSVAILTATMVVGTIFGSIGLLGWIMFALVTVPIAYKPFRIDFISTKLLAFYNSVTPDLSSTEQEAIDAGTVWWDGDLFSGRPDWQKLHAIAQPKLTSDEQAFLDVPCEEVLYLIHL